MLLIKVQNLKYKDIQDLTLFFHIYNFFLDKYFIKNYSIQTISTIYTKITRKKKIVSKYFE